MQQVQLLFKSDLLTQFKGVFFLTAQLQPVGLTQI